jgi:hypothetical protein
MRVEAGIPYDICVRATKSELVPPSRARLSFGRRASGGVPEVGRHETGYESLLLQRDGRWEDYASAQDE